MTSVCHQRFRLKLSKEAAILQKIGGGCSLRGYDLSTHDRFKISGVVSKKLASLFHILSRSHPVNFNKKYFHAVKALGLINLTNFSFLITQFTIGTIIIIMIYCISLFLVLLRSEFRLGIPSLYYVNVRNLGNSNILSIYLGTDIDKYQIKSGKYNLSMLITKYENNEINTAEGQLKFEDIKLRKVKPDRKQQLENGYCL